MGWKRVEEEGGWIDGSLGYLATFSFLRQVRRGAGFFLPEVVEIRGDKKGGVSRKLAKGFEGWGPRWNEVFFLPVSRIEYYQFVFILFA